MAASGDPVQILWVRQALDLRPAPAPADLTVPVPEALRLMRIAKRCPYRSRPTACGCTGHLCGISRTVKSDRECWECVGRYGAD